MTDTVDTVLSQAVVVAYAVPEVGPVIAAMASIAQVFYDKNHPDNSDYSFTKAITDLGARIHKELEAQRDKWLFDTIAGWQWDVRTTGDDIANYATTGPKTYDDASKLVADYLTARNFGATFGDFDDKLDGSAERVQALDTYFKARTTFHSVCLIKLKYLARANGQDPEVMWTTVHDPFRTRLEESLQDALDYTRATVTALDDALQHGQERAHAAAAAETDPHKRNALLTAELRRINNAAHVQYATANAVANFLGHIDLYDQTLRSLKACPLQPRTDGDQTSTTTQSGTTTGTGTTTTAGTGTTTTGTTTTGTTTPVAPTLGPQPAGTVRFLYETAPKDWVDVVADSAVSPGVIATQNAGSNLPGLYYQFGGLPINGKFAAQLTAAGQLHSATKALGKAYEAHYPGSSYDTDSKATSPPQDKLTSLLVPLAPGAPPVGDLVYAVIYSVGPQLGAKGIEDEAAYQQIYADAFACIAQWNAARTPIVNFRVTLLSTGAFAGTSGGPALRAQAARLVIDATVAAVKSTPLLATLKILVNTNDSTGVAGVGVERAAFDTAAAARGITPTRQGFDVPLT